MLATRYIVKKNKKEEKLKVEAGELAQQSRLLAVLTESIPRTHMMATTIHSSSSRGSYTFFWL